MSASQKLSHVVQSHDGGDITVNCVLSSTLHTGQLKGKFVFALDTAFHVAEAKTGLQVMERRRKLARLLHRGAPRGVLLGRLAKIQLWSICEKKAIKRTTRKF